MSWIAEYDTQGREFPTCVHVTKTTGGMIHGATYVPIEDGEAARAENKALREYVNAMAIQSYKGEMFDCGYCPFSNQCYNDEPKEHQGRGCQWWLWARELGIEV